MAKTFEVSSELLVRHFKMKDGTHPKKKIDMMLGITDHERASKGINESMNNASINVKVVQKKKP